MLKKGFFNNWKRRVVQTGSLALLGEWSFYGIFRCPYAVPYIGCGNCPVVQCPGRSLWMWSWILIFASSLFMGRVFCGWVWGAADKAANLTGESPVMSIARFRHVMIPQFMWVTTCSLRGVNGPAALKLLCFSGGCNLGAK